MAEETRQWEKNGKTVVLTGKVSRKGANKISRKAAKKTQSRKEDAKPQDKTGFRLHLRFSFLRAKMSSFAP